MSDLSDVPDDRKDLIRIRAQLFSLLLMRLRVLHANRPVPQSYYIGQEYAEDPASVQCTIAANFLSPGYVEPFEFWFHKTKVNGTQYGNVLLVTADRRLSLRLWDDLRLKRVRAAVHSRVSKDPHAFCKPTSDSESL
jgi:hypothetical protein